MNKFEYVRDILLSDKAKNKKLKLLDVGCRGCELKGYVEHHCEYEGVDLFQNTDGSVNYVLDVSKGIPLKDRTYNCVVALDLLEHLDDFEGGLNELLRLTDKSLILMLPNIAHIYHRIKFLLKGRISEKYDMHYKMGKDRHKWLTTHAQVDEVIKLFAKENGLNVRVIWFTGSPKKEFFARFCRLFGISPNLYSWASFYVLERK